MTRSEVMNKLTQLYPRLTESEKDNFSKIANKLLSVNYICGFKDKDKNDYYFIDRHYELFECYLSLLDYEFAMNRGDKVVYIENIHKYNHLNLKKLQSVILLILKKVYFQKMQEITESDFITMTLGELHAEINATGIYEKRITQTDLRESIQVLTRYNICERIGEFKNDDSRLIIYPTINYVLPLNKIDELYARMNTYKKGASYEEVDESQTD